MPCAMSSFIIHCVSVEMVLQAMLKASVMRVSIVEKKTVSGTSFFVLIRFSRYNDFAVVLLNLCTV